MSAMATAERPPGTVVASVAYEKGRRIGDVTLDDISDVLERPDTFVWIGLFEPDETLLRKMQEEFGLHDLAIEDALAAHQRPKIERYDDSVFVVLRTAQIESGSLPCAITIGIVFVAFFIAPIAVEPPATITSGLRETSSLAKPGRRFRSPSAYRASMPMF